MSIGSIWHTDSDHCLALHHNNHCLHYRRFQNSTLGRTKLLAARPNVSPILLPSLPQSHKIRTDGYLTIQAREAISGEFSQLSYQYITKLLTVHSASSSTTSLGALIRDVQDSYRGLGPAVESDGDDSSEVEAVRALIRPLNIAHRPLLDQTPPEGSNESPANQEETEERLAQIEAPVEPLPMAKKKQSKAKHEADKSGNVPKSSPMGVSKTAKKKATFNPAILFEGKSKLIGVDLQVCLPRIFHNIHAHSTL